MDENPIPMTKKPSSRKPPRRRSRWLVLVIVLAFVFLAALCILGIGMMILVKDSGFKGVVDKAKEN